VITLEAVAARRAPLALGSISATWDAGVHALLGARGDGGPLLLALAAGVERARTGHVRVLGGAPLDGATRTRVGYVPREPALPDALRVDELFAVASALRGEPVGDVHARLAALGVGSLAQRRVRTLTLPEARTVALAEAATSRRVRVLLVEEPLVGVDPRAVNGISEMLRARARDGAAILVATASVRDAAEVADDFLRLSSGAIVGRADSVEALAGLGHSAAAVRIVVRGDARPLVVALAGAPHVDGVQREGPAVVAYGREPFAMAETISRAVIEAGVDVLEIAPVAPSLDETRATPANVAARTP
jgi:ABC-2 type transport system ATP-binding protein